MANRSNATQRACCYGIVYGSNSFRLFGLNFRLLLRLNFLWQLGLLGFLFLLTLIFVAGLFLGNLDFMQILITKYATGSLKAMGNFSIYLFPCCYYMLLINCICGLKIFWYSWLETNFHAFFKIGELI